MQVEFTREQEAKLDQFASVRGINATSLVKDVALRLIDLDCESLAKSPMADDDGHAKLCPECGFRFLGDGWDGLDAHWRSRHQAAMSYEAAWPLIRSGLYESKFLDELEVLLEAEKRLALMRAGQGATYSKVEVAREVALVDSVQCG